MTETDPQDLEQLRKRLGFRAWHRGTREADLLIGSFADAHLPDFGAAELAAFQRLLECADPDLYNWMSGREEPPADLRGPVLDKLIAFDPGQALRARWADPS